MHGCIAISAVLASQFLGERLRVSKKSYNDHCSLRWASEDSPPCGGRVCAESLYLTLISECACESGLVRHGLDPEHIGTRGSINVTCILDKSCRHLSTPECGAL